MVNALVEDHATEDGETTVEGDGLGDSESTHTKREDHWGKAAEGDDAKTAEQRATQVEEGVVPDACQFDDSGANEDLLTSPSHRRTRDHRPSPQCTRRRGKGWRGS